MSQAQTQEFSVEVEDIGAFHFAKRTMRHEFRIQAEYSRLIEGVETPTASLELMAGVVATLKVLTVKAPSGWNIDDMDPLDDDVYRKLLKVNAALRAKEGSFRRGPEAGGAGAGQADRAEPGVRVPAAVSAGAD